MRHLIHLYVVLIAVGLSVPALAQQQEMSPILPGLMCQNPDALARLTLPNGASRIAVKSPAPADVALRDEGHCQDALPGTLISRRNNTSIISVNPGNGAPRQTYIVPNIDYNLSTDNLSALRANSQIKAIPNQCYENADEILTLSGVIRSDTFDPENGAPYRYRYLSFQSPICVRGDGTTYSIAQAVTLKIDHMPGIPDGAQVTVQGKLGVIDAGIQPGSLQLIGNSIVRH